MLQKPSEDFTLIIYNSPKPPRFIKIKKRLIRSLIISIPILLIFSLFFSLISSVYMKTKLETVRSKEPEIIAKLKSEKDNLKSEINSLRKSNKELINKISQGANETPASTLALFSTPLGFQDMTDQKQVKLENISTNFKENEIELRFDLLNNLDSSEKLTGYITIVQHHDNKIEIYPKNDIKMDITRLDYTNGESFTVSRFRPVVAPFSKPNSLNVWYKIYIFSSTGNLLSFKTAGPYQVN